MFVRLDLDDIDVKNDVNGREGMVSIRCPGKAIYGRFWSQENIRSRFEVADIEQRGTYQRSRVEGGTKFTHPS